MAFVANEYTLGEIVFELTFLVWDFVKLPHKKAEQYHFCQMQEKTKLGTSIFIQRKLEPIL